MNINLTDMAFLIFSLAMVSFAVYSIILLFSNIYLRPSAKDVAAFSLSTFIFGFLISSYIDDNAPDMLFSSILLVLVVFLFSYKSIKKKLTDKNVQGVT